MENDFKSSKISYKHAMSLGGFGDSPLPESPMLRLKSKLGIQNQRQRMSFDKGSEKLVVMDQVDIF